MDPKAFLHPMNRNYVRHHLHLLPPHTTYLAQKTFAAMEEAIETYQKDAQLNDLAVSHANLHADMAIEEMNKAHTALRDLLEASADAPQSPALKTARDAALQCLVQAIGYSPPAPKDTP